MAMLGEISEKNFILHEFIGQQTTIVASPDKSFLNRSGVIIDETMKTFTMEFNDNGKIRNIIVPKHKTVFSFTIPVDSNDIKNNNSKKSVNRFEKTIEINGTILTKRSEDRIKKLVKIAKSMNRGEARNPHYIKIKN
jgi:RNase P/RNase MRP subunit p29